MEESLLQFCAKWQLDPEAQNFLRSLEPGALEVVLSDFAPHEGTQDVAGKLYSFAKGISRQPRQEGVEAFIQKWNLDLSTAKWVRELPQEVKDPLVRDFQPKEDTQNITGKLKGFARSILSRHQHATGLGGLTSSNGDERLQEFVTRWGVEESLSFLQGLPPLVLAKVLEQFDPKGDTMNINGRLCSFARSVADRMGSGVTSLPATAVQQPQMGLVAPQMGLMQPMMQPMMQMGMPMMQPMMGTVGTVGTVGMDPLNTFFMTQMPQGQVPMGMASMAMAPAMQLDPVSSFCSRWGLSDQSRHFLLQLPQEVLNIVVAEFSPAAHTANLDGKLQTFAKSVLDRFQVAHPSTGTTVIGTSSNPQIAEFVRKWSMDEEAAAFLDTLPEGPLQTVLGEFHPRAGTRNMTGKLKAFGSTVMGTQGYSIPRAPDAAGGGLDLNTLDLGEVAFLQKWGIEHNVMVKETLSTLTTDQRLRVLRDFEPAADTVDVAARLCSFAKSVARGKGAGKGVGVAPGMGLKRPADFGDGLDPLRQRLV